MRHWELFSQKSRSKKKKNPIITCIQHITEDLIQCNQKRKYSNAYKSERKKHPELTAYLRDLWKLFYVLTGMTVGQYFGGLYNIYPFLFLQFIQYLPQDLTVLPDTNESRTRAMWEFKGIVGAFSFQNNIRTDVTVKYVIMRHII